MTSRAIYKALAGSRGRFLTISQQCTRNLSTTAWRAAPEASTTSDNKPTLESLVPPAEAIKTPIRRAVQEATEPITQYNLTIAKLMAAGLHLGHSTSLWEPSTLPFIFGTREGISIINLEHTLVYLRRACNVTREIATRGGTILFIGTRPGFQDLTIDAARHCEGFQVSSKWIPGTLTNRFQVLGRHATPDPENPGRPSKTFKPDLIVLLNPLENKIAIAEAQLHNIPIIAITDTDYDPRLVAYPIPANDDSIRGVELIAKVISSAAKDGLFRRKQLLDQKEKEAKNRMSKRF
ncbi:ribosomal protein S2, flavodoxin-like domain-containing protein [Radiomyces spectabilis]|uniref:ribosomal protein S2, flavodoxin-like domain-containing protein n=1 Tax=Radiomyces spectabilis TaxID=64574 RepID=UPI00221E4932|nr:ribosomal protein S2, flavodoxin-like domain-containing protein [Radiomyces spectabilis]KAI8371464.1 ribosomal protein S2, flavodoxin-like domain-containing protein [Radiomyces spectabilis]